MVRFKTIMIGVLLSLVPPLILAIISSLINLNSESPKNEDFQYRDTYFVVINSGIYLVLFILTFIIFLGILVILKRSKRK
jgi:hypothetical protein